jgi:hypothetical protein
VFEPTTRLDGSLENSWEGSGMGYWIAAGCLILLNAISVLSNLLMLPGNWLMTGTLCVFLLVTDFEQGPGWTIVIVSAGLAAVGEILELVLGSAKAARKGASRRAVVLSLVFSIAGSLAGTMLIPIPIVGSAIGAVLGAAAGAFGGAWLGEASIGTEVTKRNEISSAAMTGRLIGMLAKLVIGVAIFVVQLVSFFTR